MLDMDGRQVRVGDTIVIGWSGGELMKATVTGVSWRILVLKLSNGREYRRRHVSCGEFLILNK